MSRRILALAPLLVATLLYAGVCLPLRARARLAAEEYRDVRRQRHDVQSQLAHLERRETARRQAAVVFASAAGAEGGPAAAVRRSVLATLRSARASGVRLAVRPAPTAGGTTVHVSAAGPFAEAVRLSRDLVAPGTGLILDRVRLDRRSELGQIRFDLDALAPEGRP